MTKYVKEVLARLEDIKVEQDWSTRLDKIRCIVKDTLVWLDTGDTGDTDDTDTLDLEMWLSSIYFNLLNDIWSGSDEDFLEELNNCIKSLTKIY